MIFGYIVSSCGYTQLYDKPIATTTAIVTHSTSKIAYIAVLAGQYMIL